MKHNLIIKYKIQLESSSGQILYIPPGFEDRFWDWFDKKSYMFDSKNIRKNLRKTSIPIANNFCFKNSYRIAKGFIKRLFYFEGFSYSASTDFALKHAFNVCKHGKVNDYSLNNKHDEKQDVYIGVKIPLTFARKVYQEHGDYTHAQDSLLVPYFMYQLGLENYLDYTSP